MSVGKVCKYCNVFKDFSMFHKHDNTIDGLKGKCKDCCSKWNKEYNLKNRPGYKASNLDRVKLCSSDPSLKICSNCMVEKKIEDFRHKKYGRSNHLYGPMSECRSCQIEYNMAYNKKMKGKLPPKTKEQTLKNTEYMRQKKLNDPEYHEKCLARARKAKNTEECRAKARIQRKKWLENPANRIAKNMRDRMRAALRGLSKKESTLNMTGIPFEDLKIYLESKFDDHMSWDNYGTKGWHVDHIIPCNFFDFEKEEHQQICFYYKNLQPMWAKANISKGGRVNIDNIQPLLEEIKMNLGL